MINLNQTVSKKFASFYRNAVLAYSLFMLVIAVLALDEANMMLCPLMIFIGNFIAFVRFSTVIKQNNGEVKLFQIAKNICLVGRSVFIGFLYVAIVFKRADHIMQLILCIAFSIGIEVLCYYYYEKK